MPPFSAQAHARALFAALRRLAAGFIWTTAGLLPLALGAADGAVTGLVTAAAAMPAAVLAEWALNQITARLSGGLALGALLGWALTRRRPPLP